MTERFHYKVYLQKLLLEKAILVRKCISGQLSLTDLQNSYGNFYYYEALDGHEADESQKTILEEFFSVIEFHQYVQTEVLDKVYTENSEVPEDYINAGRISKFEANRRLKYYWDKYETFIAQLTS
jgi:hypothetical protein